MVTAAEEATEETALTDISLDKRATAQGQEEEEAAAAAVAAVAAAVAAAATGGRMPQRCHRINPRGWRPYVTG